MLRASRSASAGRPRVAWRPRAFVGLLGAVVLLLSGTTSSAFGASQVFEEAFTGNSITVPSDWTSLKGGSEAACLTARSSGSAVTGVVGAGGIAGCVARTGEANPVDTAGSGVLRLTRDVASQSPAVIYNRAQSMSDGLDITFNLAMWGGGSNSANGLTFFLKDGSHTPDEPGAFGGALGYALMDISPLRTGLPGALIGVGFDSNGAFSNQTASETYTKDCTAGQNLVVGANPSNPPVLAVYRNNITVRGPDLSTSQDGSCGYEFLGWSSSSAAAHTTEFVDFGQTDAVVGTSSGTTAATTRAAAARSARIVIDKPGGANPRVKVWIWTLGQTQPTTPTIDIAQPAQFANVSTFKFGFTAGTGSAVNVHEVWDVRVVLADPTVQALQAASATPTPAGPALACSPDPVVAGALVTCDVTRGDPSIDILWEASVGGVAFASQGVRTGADGTGTFTFLAPAGAAGRAIDVQLVGWGVETDVDVVAGGPVPTRVDAGAAPSGHGMLAGAALLLAALAGILRRRATSH